MKTLPKIKGGLGEAQITPEMLQKVAPDVMSFNGHVQLAKKMIGAHGIKPEMDSYLKQIAKATGASESSRIKNADTAQKKTAQKRLQGRDYKLNDINDWYGGRLSVAKDKDLQKVIDAVEAMGKAGAFKILKSQLIKDPDSDYIAHHFDVEKDGVRGEIQVMTMHNAARAAGSHDQHAEYGEKLPDHEQKLVKTQNKVIDTLPPIKAKQVADTLVKMHKQNDDQILPTGVVPETIAKIAQNS